MDLILLLMELGPEVTHSNRDVKKIHGYSGISMFPRLSQESKLAPEEIPMIAIIQE